MLSVEELQKKVADINIAMEEAVVQAAFSGCAVFVDPERPDAPRFYPPKVDEVSGGIIFFAQEDISTWSGNNFIRIPLGVKVRAYGGSQLMLTAYSEEGPAASMIPKIIMPHHADKPLYVTLMVENTNGGSIPEGTPIALATAIQQQPLFMLLSSGNYKPIEESQGGTDVSK